MNVAETGGKGNMRATDDRYRREQARFNLAMRLIEHEARTGTIRYLTGLQDDRIRKLYTTYFKYDAQPVRRRRGRSMLNRPFANSRFVNTPDSSARCGVRTSGATRVGERPRRRRTGCVSYLK